MSNPIRVKEIADALSVQMDGAYQYLNKETGEIVLVSDEELGAVEMGEKDDYPEWQQEVIRQAEQIIVNEGGKFVELPSKFEVHEYQIMEQFCLSISDPKISDELYYVIKGRGAFRRFKDRIHYYGLAEAWYEYFEAALMKIAIAWCERHAIEYV